MNNNKSVFLQGFHTALQVFTRLQKGILFIEYTGTFVHVMYKCPFFASIVRLRIVEKVLS